jgi:hypothetical protein
MLLRCGLASRNAAAAVHVVPEHDAVVMQNSTCQMKINATAVCSTLQQLRFWCMLQIVLLARKAWPPAQNSSAGFKKAA